MAAKRFQRKHLRARCPGKPNFHLNIAPIVRRGPALDRLEPQLVVQVDPVQVQLAKRIGMFEPEVDDPDSVGFAPVGHGLHPIVDRALLETTGPTRSKNFVVHMEPISSIITKTTKYLALDRRQWQTDPHAQALNTAPGHQAQRSSSSILREQNRVEESKKSRTSST